MVTNVVLIFAALSVLIGAATNFRLLGVLLRILKNKKKA